MPVDLLPSEESLPVARVGDEPPPGPVAAIGPRLHGVIDVIRADRISGWAIDRSDSAAALEIDIVRSGRLVATVRADRHRGDLERGGVGTGRYGFSAAIAPQIEPGFEFTVKVVARAADGANTILKRAGGAEPVSPDRRLLEQTYEEVGRLGRALALRQASPAVTAGTEESTALAGTLDRIEIAQARIEAALSAVEPPPPGRSERGLSAILLVTLAIALGSLGLGLYSLWLP